MADDEAFQELLQSQEQADAEVGVIYDQALAASPPNPTQQPRETEEAGADEEAALEGEAIQVLGPREQEHGPLVYYPWKDTVDFDAVAGDPAKTLQPPYLSRLKRAVNIISTQAIVELVERYMMPEGRLAPVSIYNATGQSIGFLSLYRYERAGGKQSKKKAKLSESGPSISKEEEPEEPEDGGPLKSGYSQFKPPQGSIAEQEIAAFKTAYDAWARSKGGNGPSTPTLLLNVAHICWRYFHRMGNNRPIQISPERYTHIMQYARGDRSTWESVRDSELDPAMLCRRLPLGLQISHQAEAYDLYDWNPGRDIHPDFRDAYGYHAKRRAKGAKDVLWGPNAGYKVEVSECEDILQQSMRKACSQLGLMFCSATTGQLITEWGNQLTQCPHAVHGFPCYGPRSLAFRNDWPSRSSIRNRTSASQIREVRGALAQTAHLRPSGNALAAGFTPTTLGPLQ